MCEGAYPVNKETAIAIAEAHYTGGAAKSAAFGCWTTQFNSGSELQMEDGPFSKGVTAMQARCPRVFVGKLVRITDRYQLATASGAVYTFDHATQQWITSAFIANGAAGYNAPVNQWPGVVAIGGIEVSDATKEEYGWQFIGWEVKMA